jgi:hypothetical protein
VEKYPNPLAAEEESTSPMVKIVKNIFKLLISIVNVSRMEIGGNSHPEIDHHGDSKIQALINIKRSYLFLVLVITIINIS